MSDAVLTDLKRRMSDLPYTSSVGRVCSLDGHSIRVTGLENDVSLEDRVLLKRKDGTRLMGEVLRIDQNHITILPDGPPHQVALSDRVHSVGPVQIYPCKQWVGRVIDPYGQPLDGMPLPKGPVALSIENEPPNPVLRQPLGSRLNTGFHLFNTLLPIAKGQRVGLFAGSGVGKTTLLADLIKSLDADIVVLALVGERGREIQEFTHTILGAEGMARTIVVGATADTSATARKRCPQTAMRVAEFFRESGLHVLLFVDSMTRFAEAHRETAVAAGEFPSLRGFPASTPPALTKLVERAGPGGLGTGYITAVLSVLVAASDLEEPVADMLRGAIDGHIVLDRSRAERGVFPAVDVLKSVSRALPRVASDADNNLIKKARSLLSVYEDSKALFDAGLYTEGTDTTIDQARAFQPLFEELLTKRSEKGMEASFEALALSLRRITTAGSVS